MPITFPNGFTTRDYQDSFFKAMGSGCKRAILVWHRRAGKDVSAWNWMILEAMRKTGTYYYFFPTYSQGKKILWDGFDKNGKKFLHYIPNHEKCYFNETEMQIELPAIEGGSNGSIIQIIGTDKMDYIVGTNPIGCIFSEYSIQNPLAWDYTEPILEENGGWAVFVYTPRGNNHGKRLYYRTKCLNYWYSSLLTIRDTKRADGQPIVTEAQIQRLREQGKDEDIIQQEYYCDFTGSQQGSYYSKLLAQAEKEGRIRPVPHVQGVPVQTYWDIGHSDSTVVGFVQHIHGNRHWINCLEHSGEGLPYYASELEHLRKQHYYHYGRHHFPHDMKVTDFGSGEQRIQAARKLGLRPSVVIPKMSLDQGIDAVRRAFQTYIFDEKQTERLRDALTNYQKVYNEKLAEFTNAPVHNWASHFADMVRVEATSQHLPDDRDILDLPRTAITQADPLQGQSYDVFE